MQSSKSSSFAKSVKRSKAFDDGYGGRRNNKKFDFNKQQRAKGNMPKKDE